MCVFYSTQLGRAKNKSTNQWAHQALAEALNQLGISEIYHMREVGKNKHQDLWIRALEDNLEGKGPAWGRDDFEKILAGFQVRVPSVWFTIETKLEHGLLYTRSMLTRWIQGAADFPAAIFPKQLVDAYPEAAIILSTRPEDAWYTSMMSTLIHYHTNVLPGGPSPMAALSTKYHTLCWSNDFATNGRDYFRGHNEAVRRLGEGRRFLEWDPEDGWAPLCGFLGVPVPEIPFPRADDWAQFNKLVSAQPQHQP